MSVTKKFLNWVNRKSKYFFNFESCLLCSKENDQYNKGSYETNISF